MTAEESQPSANPPGGFVGGARKRAADDILAARDAVAGELPVTVRWPAPAERAQGIAALFEIEDGASRIEGHVERGQSGLVITHVRVSAPTPGGVTQRMLRDAPLTGILKAIRAYVRYEDARRAGTRAILGQEPAPGLFAPGDDQIPKTSGRTPMTDSLLRQVALAFIEETGTGKDRRALQRMAQRFDRPEGTIRTWIARARKEGWLAPGSKGRIGAEAGPRLGAALFDDGLDEIEPPGGAPTASDLIGVKRGAEAQVAEHNERVREWQGLADGDPRKAELERQIKIEWSRKSGQ